MLGTIHAIITTLQRVVQVKKTEDDENTDEEVLEEELIALSHGVHYLCKTVTIATFENIPRLFNAFCCCFYCMHVWYRTRFL